jgi:hypothetical protein
MGVAMKELEYLKDLKEYLLSLDLKDEYDSLRRERVAVDTVIIKIDTLLSHDYQEHMRKAHELLGRKLDILKLAGLPDKYWATFEKRSVGTIDHLLFDLTMVAFASKQELPLLLSYTEDMTDVGNGLLKWRMEQPAG